MDRGKRARLGFLAACLIAGAVLTGCERKTINQILAEPDRYARRDVAIVGNVVESYSVLGRGAYRVDDGTGRIWVVSDKGVPRKGARVGVKGRIKNGFDLGSIIRLPEAFRSGLVMVEISHRAK